MNVRKPIQRNPVYCKILYYMGNKKRYVSELLKLFVSDEFDDEKNNKSQPVLREQLLVLKKEGYVGEFIEKGKKFDKNKKMFYVIWEKIADEFVEFLINYYTAEKQIYSTIDTKDYSYFFDETIKNLRAHRKEYKNNYFLKSSFIYLFNEFSHHNHIIILEELFRNIIYFNVLEKIRIKILETTGYAELEFRDMTIFNKMFLKEIGKEKVKDFDLFTDLANNIRGSVEYYNGITPSVAYYIGKELIGEEKLKVVQFSNLDDDEEDKKPYYPITEEQNSIKKTDVKKVIDEVEKIRKDKHFTDLKRLKSFLIELKFKFYFLYPLLKRFMDVGEVRNQQRLDVLKRELINMELGLISCYDLRSEFDTDDILKEFEDLLSHKRSNNPFGKDE